MTFLDYIQHLERNNCFYGNIDRTIADLVEMYNEFVKR